MQLDVACEMSHKWEQLKIDKIQQKMCQQGRVSKWQRKKIMPNERERKTGTAERVGFFLSVTQLHIYFYINDVSSCGCCFNLNI